MSLHVPSPPQLGRLALSLCYLRDVLITSFCASLSCKAPPDHPALWAASYLLALSSPSITAHEFYLSLPRMRLISMNNWNSWLVTQCCCHQGGWGCKAHIQLFLYFHSRDCRLAQDNLTFVLVQADCSSPSKPHHLPTPSSPEQLDQSVKLEPSESALPLACHPGSS